MKLGIIEKQLPSAPANFKDYRVALRIAPETLIIIPSFASIFKLL